MNKSHEYWSSRTTDADGNRPNAYVKTSSFQEIEMFNSLQPHINKDSNILEIGCNVGRNLNYLYGQGYKNLTGIEINPNAIEVGRNHFKELYSDPSVNISVGPAKDFLSNNSNQYDAIFTLAVLQHMIQEEQDFALNWIAEHTKCACFIEMRGNAARPAKWPAHDGYFHNGIKNYSILINKGFKVVEEGPSAKLGSSYTRTLLIQ